MFIAFVASAIFVTSLGNPVPDTSILQASFPSGNGGGFGGSSFGGGVGAPIGSISPPIGSGAGVSGANFGNGGGIGSGAGVSGSNFGNGGGIGSGAGLGGSGIGGGVIGSGAGFGSGPSGSCAWSHCENGICSSRGCTMTGNILSCAIDHFSACVTACPFDCFGPQLSACLRSCRSGCYCYDGFIFDASQNVCIRIENCSP